MAEQSLRDAMRSRLRTILASVGDVEEYLQASVGGVGELIQVDGSYTLSTVLYDAPYTVATTDRESWEAGQVEFDTEDGPCFDLLTKGTTFDGVDLRTERRWPAWAAVANLLGFRSSCAVGAELEPGQRLVLNSYSGDDAFLDHAAVQRAQLFVDELAFTLPIALRLAQQSTQVSQLQQALASRSTIDQALGVLMAQNRCTRDEAFGILRRASQNRNIKLRDVAGAIIERYTGHPAEPPAPFHQS